MVCPLSPGTTVLQVSTGRLRVDDRWVRLSGDRQTESPVSGEGRTTRGEHGVERCTVTVPLGVQGSL